MNLTSTRRADDFHRLLETGARTDDPVDAPMLALAEALQALPTVDGPRPEFRQALRQRLVAVATVQGVGAPADTPISRVREAGRSWRVQRRLTALAAGAAVVTGVSGVALGATRSLPGDPLYGVKKAAESIQLATTTGTEARGKRHLEFARTRLSEVTSLAEHHDSGPIVSTLHAMDIETRDGANDLLAAYREDGSLEPLQTLSLFSSEQYSRLHALLPLLPADAQAPARASLALLAVVSDRTLETARSAGAATPAPAQPSGPQPTAPATGGSTAPPGAVVPTTAPSATVPGSQPAPGSTTTRSSQNPLPAPSTLLPSGSILPTTLLPTTQPAPLPTVSGSLTSPLPLSSIATIPPLPASTPLPTSLPTLPSLLPGLGG